ncbi:response regulator [Paenibacillus foliorum]|nr:response regulator [Paenibacillus foliorum]
MYKVIIIDDDCIIRRGLIQLIPWNEHGFELAGSSDNGKDGLELIRKVQPHLIITDIRMPFMNGLELTEIVKEEYPHIKIIMLTSYDDFDFAKQALKLKVFDYLLKPFDNETIIKAAASAMHELAYEYRISQKVTEALPILRQKFLEKLINGKLSEYEIVSGAEFLELALPDTSYVTMVLKADDYSYSEYPSRFGKEMLKYCVLNVAEETLGSKGQGILFDSVEDEVVMICFIKENEEQAKEKAFLIAEDIRRNIENFLKTTITAAIGGVYQTYEGISYSYKDAQAALEIRHILGTNRVIRRFEYIEPTGSMDISNLKNEFILNVKLSFLDKALLNLTAIERSILEAKNVSLLEVQRISMEITLLLYKEMEIYTKGDESLDLAFRKIQQFQTVHNIFLFIADLITTFIPIIHSKSDSQTKRIINQAVVYMKSYFYYENLSLQDVAKTVHISPTYLSIIFKKEMNINFSDYLQTIRMNEAKELFRNSNLKTYEVAERVGFSNPQYFSVWFKKNTGMSPKDFKSQSVGLQKFGN